MSSLLWELGYFRNLFDALKASFEELGVPLGLVNAEHRDCLVRTDPEVWSRVFDAFDEPGVVRLPGAGISLGTLTLIRRLQGRPDPLEIVIERVDRGSTNSGTMPVLYVWMRSAPSEWVPFRVPADRPDEHSRFRRWDVLLLEESGVEAATLDLDSTQPQRIDDLCGEDLSPGCVLGGGVKWVEGAVPHRFEQDLERFPRSVESTWPMTLATGLYRTPRQGGSYTLRVVFDASQTLPPEPGPAWREDRVLILSNPDPLTY
ncbi:MAG: hypothetical protein AAF726_20195 [Planctomycetota bacterium]